MPEATLNLVKEAVTHARKVLPYGSGNKRRQGISQSEAKKGWDRMERWKTAKGNLEKLRNKQYTEFGEYHNELTSHCLSGNCTELALIAWLFLRDKDVRPIQMVRLKPPGDHVFAIAGKRDGTLEDIDSWGKSVLICDPWANIACPSDLYKLVWGLQMIKWSASFKEVKYQEQWIDPLRKDWYSAIDTHKIVPYCSEDGGEVKFE